VLVRQGIVSQQAAAQVMEALRRFPTDTSTGTGPQAIAAVDERLAQQLGADASRWFVIWRDGPIERSSVLHLTAREVIRGQATALARLARAILGLAGQLGERPGAESVESPPPASTLLAYAETLYRDGARMREDYVRADILPWGVGEPKEQSFWLDRRSMAQLLGMHAVTRSRADALVDVDFLAENLGSLAILTGHLARLSRDLSRWSGAAPVESGAALVRWQLDRLLGAAGEARGLAEVDCYLDAASATSQALRTLTRAVQTARRRESEATLNFPAAPSQLAEAIQAALERVEALEQWIAERRLAHATLDGFAVDE
jgi:hypothetical protein